MLTDPERQAIRRSWRLLEPLGETVPDLFYRRLFEIRPDLRSLFPTDIEGQKRKLLAMLGFAVKSIDWPLEQWAEEQDPENDLFLVILALGRRHQNLYHVTEEHYGPVGEALVWTLDQGLGEVFQGVTKDAWIRLYTLLATTMKLSSRVSFPAQSGG